MGRATTRLAGDAGSGRPPVQRRRVVDAIRRRIVANQLAPGARLPSRQKLAGRYHVSLATAQSALEELARGGFVQTRGTTGTFVAERPPHLHSYALLMPCSVQDRNMSRYWQVLGQVAARLEAARGCTISLWHSIDDRRNSPDYLAVRELVLNHQVAGLIFATTPWQLRGSELLDEPGVPRVAIMPQVAGYPGLAQVHFDGSTFFRQALDLLEQRGCRRIAMFAAAHSDAFTFPHFHDMLKDRKLETRPYWVQQVNLSSPATARACAHLMLRPGQTDQPDGLIIADDNLAPAVQLGLIDAGVSGHGDVTVVCHCNYPGPPEKLMPMTLLGYDLEQTLAACLDAIDHQRQGRGLPAAVKVEARFERPAERAEPHLHPVAATEQGMTLR